MAAKNDIESHGGLVGINYLNILDSYTVSSVKGGAICGENRGIIKHCYGNGTPKNISVISSGEEIGSWAVKKPAEMKVSDTGGWDFRRIWNNNISGLPTFKDEYWYADSELKDNYLIIDSADKLLEFSNKILAGDSEAAKTNVLLTVDINLKNKKMKPIGTKDNPYTGVFDGVGHVISNLLIAGSENGPVGLFGYISKAKICNLTVKGNVYGGTETGLICGKNEMSDILCCSAAGEVYGLGYVGGLSGNNSGNISQCSFYGYIRRGKPFSLLSWGIPVIIILLLELCILGIILNNSSQPAWKVYKPVATQETIKPITNDIQTDQNTDDNSITIKVNNQAVYNGGEDLFLRMSNPSVSNQNAVLEVVLAEEYLKGTITYDEAGIYNSKYNYLTIAKTGAIPPGYEVEHFQWLGDAEEEFLTGTYPAFVRIWFYDAVTNEKSLIDTVFEIELVVN